MGMRIAHTLGTLVKIPLLFAPDACCARTLRFPPRPASPYTGTDSTCHCPSWHGYGLPCRWCACGCRYHRYAIAPGWAGSSTASTVGWSHSNPSRWHPHCYHNVWSLCLCRHCCIYHVSDWRCAPHPYYVLFGGGSHHLPPIFRNCHLLSSTLDPTRCWYPITYRYCFLSYCPCVALALTPSGSITYLPRFISTMMIIATVILLIEWARLLGSYYSY